MLKTNQTSGSSLAKPGPLKAFTSPVSPSNSGESKCHTEQDKIKTGAIPKSKAHLVKKTVSEKDHHVKHGAKLNSAKHLDSSKTVGNQGIKASHMKSATDKRHNSQDNISAEMSLEAVVTLSKNNTGETQEVHLMPSPPSSSKPTTPRPSSAQRFRRMVLDCRDPYT